MTRCEPVPLRCTAGGALAAAAGPRRCGAAARCVPTVSRPWRAPTGPPLYPYRPPPAICGARSAPARRRRLRGPPGAGGALSAAPAPSRRVDLCRWRALYVLSLKPWRCDSTAATTPPNPKQEGAEKKNKHTTPHAQRRRTRTIPARAAAAAAAPPHRGAPPLDKRRRSAARRRARWRGAAEAPAARGSALSSQPPGTVYNTLAP
jgi:hypothetical protein